MYVVIYRRSTDFVTIMGNDLDVRGVWLFDRDPTEEEFLELSLEADRKEDPDAEWGPEFKFKYLSNKDNPLAYRLVGLFEDGRPATEGASHFEVHQAQPHVSYGDAVQVEEVPLQRESLQVPSCGSPQ